MGLDLWSKAIGQSMGHSYRLTYGAGSVGQDLWSTAIGQSMGLDLWGNLWVNLWVWIYGAGSVGQSNRAVYGAIYGAEQ